MPRQLGMTVFIDPFETWAQQHSNTIVADPMSDFVLSPREQATIIESYRSTRRNALAVAAFFVGAALLTTLGFTAPSHSTPSATSVGLATAAAPAQIIPPPPQTPAQPRLPPQRKAARTAAPADLLAKRQ